MPDDSQMPADVKTGTCNYTFLSSRTDPLVLKDQTTVSIYPRGDRVSMAYITPGTFSDRSIHVETLLVGDDVTRTYDGDEDVFLSDVQKKELLSVKTSLVNECRVALRREA